MSNGNAMQVARLERSQEILNQPGTGLADLSDLEFTNGIERVKKAHQRMEVILREVLVDGVDYDNPNKSFKHRILQKPGASKIRRLCRLTIRPVGSPVIVADDDWVCVTVEVAAYDAMGRVVGYASAACNTMEARFRKQNGTGWTYQHPREKVHECLAMAQKRAASALTLEVTGADGFFAKDEILEEALRERVIEPWTPEEKKLAYAKAGEKGMSRKAFAELVMAEFGRPDVSTGSEVQQLLDAIGRWQKPKKITTVEVPAANATPAGKEPSAPSPDLDDLELDQKLAEQDQAA